jgi:hypothetical protein
MPKAKRNKQHALPKRPPKRTGRRGIGPKLDPAEDFGNPVKAEEPKKPRQARLPEMQDPQIEELEAKAEAYAEVRDQRMALTPEENRLKTELLGLMKKHGKTSYVHDGYDIKVIVESEKVRVRVKKED